MSDRVDGKKKEKQGVDNDCQTQTNVRKDQITFKETENIDKCLKCHFIKHSKIPIVYA